MTARERQVMDPFDAGATRDEIIASTGMKPSYVDTIISRYRPAGSGSNFAADARRATAALLAAIKRHHPERVRETANG